MRGLSSDTSAKASAVAIALVVVFAGVAIIAFAAISSFNGSDKYTVTVSVDAMEVSSGSGSVYNVMKGGYYYDPNTGLFDLTSPSPKAILYASVTMGSKTNYSDNAYRTVQSWPIVSPTVITDNAITFKVTTADSEMKMSVFLLLKGSSNDASNGTVIDVYDKKPGESGISLSIDMKEHTESFELKGSDESTLKGYLKITVTVKAA